MTRHLLNHHNYGADASMGYRHPQISQPTHPDRTYALARQNPRADPMARQTSRSGPTPQPGVAGQSTNSTGGTPRRRIPVACGRCRKRKIRCSGDPGDNSGCNNCKQAGVAHGQCVFLRVQCEMRELVPDHLLMMGYEQVSSSSIDLHPYSSSSSASSSSSSLGLGLPAGILHSSLPSAHYIVPHAIRGHPLSFNNNIMSMKSLFRQDPIPSSAGTDPNGIYLTGGSSLMSHRTYDGLDTGEMTAGTGGHGVTGGNDMYSGGYPQYLLPDIPQAMNPAVLHSQHDLRTWSPLVSNGRSGLYVVDQDQNGHQHGYMPASNTRMPPNGMIEGYPLFPALSSLSSSLPDGASRGASLPEKMTLPPPVPSDSSSIGSRNNSGATSVGSEIVSSRGYPNQPMQPPGMQYKTYPAWGSEPVLSSTSALSVPTSKPSILNSSPSSSYMGTPTSSVSSQQPISCITAPALSVLPSLNSYSSSNSSTFPHSHSSISPHLPSMPQSTGSNGIITTTPAMDPQQILQPQRQKQRTDSDSSIGSKSSAITPSSSTRTMSTSSSPYSPPYPRSSVGGHHHHTIAHPSITVRNHSADQGIPSHKDVNAQGTRSPQQRRSLGLSRVY